MPRYSEGQVEPGAADSHGAAEVRGSRARLASPGLHAKLPPPPPCSIQALLSAPNPDDPLADNIAKHWKENEQEAVATGMSLRCAPATLCADAAPAAHAAREWTRLYAQP